MSDNEQQIIDEGKPSGEGVLPAQANGKAPETEGQVENGHDAEQAQPKAVPYEVESAARRMGWVPREDWRGPPEMWKPADEFKRRGEEVIPIVRSQLRKAEERAAELEDKLAKKDEEWGQRFQRLEKMSAVALERQKATLWQQFEKEKEKAVADGDPDRYRSLTQEQREAMANLREVEEAPKEEKKPDSPQGSKLTRAQQETVQAFVERNEWFNRDPDMTEAANAYHKRLLRTKGGLSLEENLAETERHIRKVFADAFAPAEQPKASQREQPHAPSMEGGARTGGPGGGRALGWGDIPADDRKVAERSQLQYFLPRGVDMETATAAHLEAARKEYAKQYHSA